MGPFIAYLDCTVKYDGRASSILSRGNYIVIRKADGSVSIHGASKIQSLNYIGSGAECEWKNNKILLSLRGETIEIEIYNTISIQELDDWSDNQIKIIKTEKDLALKTARNLDDYIDTPIAMAFIEYPAEDAGRVDIFARGEDLSTHIIEVKRKKCGISAISQLQRYMDYFSDLSPYGYIASPEISKNALAQLENRGYRWLEVGFSDT